MEIQVLFFRFLNVWAQGQNRNCKRKTDKFNLPDNKEEGWLQVFFLSHDDNVYHLKLFANGRSSEKDKWAGTKHHHVPPSEGRAAYNSRSNEKYLGHQESNQPSWSILTFLPKLTQAKLKHATLSFKMKQSYFLP